MAAEVIGRFFLVIRNVADAKISTSEDIDYEIDPKYTQCSAIRIGKIVYEQVDMSLSESRNDRIN